MNPTTILDLITVSGGAVLLTILLLHILIEAFHKEKT